MEESQNQRQRELEAIVAKRVRKIRRFVVHLLIYIIGLTLFILKKYCNAPFNFSPFHYFTNSFFMWCWTFFVAVQGFKLVIIEVVLNKDWEEKQVNKIIESKSNTKKWE
ncbi:MAG: 2TM domain-containing protein [Flavobacterium sp.]